MFKDAVITDLPDLLQPADVLIVNDSATLPASLFAKSPSDAPLEIRLLQHLGGSDWKAVLLDRVTGGHPPNCAMRRKDLPGSVLRIAKISPQRSSASERSGRWSHSASPDMEWTCGRNLCLWPSDPVCLSEIRPGAVVGSNRIRFPAMGSGDAFSRTSITWRILLELKRRGIGLAWLTHAAGVSATGDESLDARLPFTERFEIPQSAIDAIQKARLTGGRVIAVGTTVVRALEGCSAQNGGHLIAGAGETNLIIGPRFRRSVVDGILTGLHDPEQSHFQLLRAFVDEGILRRSWQYATENNYVCHEFGDLCRLPEHCLIIR
jgi:S-adenosylmethionine:tRNA ribosyltransferase-isomerase